MPAPAVLLDEDVRPAIVHQLRARGFDAVSVLAAGPRGADDHAVLDRAVELGRVLMTHNVDHFKSVHAEFRRLGRIHHGILCLPQRGPLERRTLRAAMMLDWVADQPRSSTLFVWGNLQQRLEAGLRLGSYSDDEVREALGRA